MPIRRAASASISSFWRARIIDCTRSDSKGETRHQIRSATHEPPRSGGISAGWFAASIRPRKVGRPFMNDVWPWLALFGLGAYHGVNPGMGWLFAVALGMQEKKRSAVLLALPPIALGHGLSIGVIVLVVALARIALNPLVLRIVAACVLFGFGLYRLVRFRHPKWVGMRVGFGDLTLWSFLMASAHGAGLILVPLFLGSAPGGKLVYANRLEPGLNLEPFCSVNMASLSSPALLLAAVGVHTFGHLILAG